MKIKKTTDIGAFVISDKAHIVLSEFRNREMLHWEGNPSFEIFEHEYQHFEIALNQIVTIAKDELNTENLELNSNFIYET